MTSEQKIDAWHDGTRLVNMKACSLEKLLDYYIWSIRKGYVFMAVDIRDTLIRKKGYFFNFPELQVCEPLSTNDFTHFASTYKNYYQRDNDGWLLSEEAEKKSSYKTNSIEYTYNGKTVTLHIPSQTVSDGCTTVSFKDHPELAINLFIKTLYGNNK